MILLIGTGHVFDLSSALLDIFEERQPEVVCVELDRQRYNAIMMRRTSPEKYKNAERNLPVVYKMLSRFQEGMAKEYGVNAGDEMLTAITYAQSHQLPLKFIDMNAQHLFTKMWRNMTFSEKFKLLLSGFGGVFVSRKRVEEELKNFQDNFDKYLEEIGKKFPTIKKTLIDDRNWYMTDKLMQLNEQYQKIVACVGDGHIPGMTRLLESKDVEFEIIRLNELRNQKTEVSDPASAHFTTTYRSL